MTSIRRHLTRRLAAGTFLIATAGLLTIFTYLRVELIEQFDNTLVSRARTLGSLVHVNEQTGALEFELSEPSMVEYRASQDPDYFEIWQADGTDAVARSESLGDGNLPRAPAGTVFDGRQRFFYLTLPDGRSGRAVEYLVEPGHEHEREKRVDFKPQPPAPGAPMVTLVLATDLADVNEAFRHVLGVLIIVIAAVSIGTGYTVVRTVRIGLEPLRAVGDAVARVDPASLATRISEQGLPEELRPIAGKLNELLGRLDAAFQRERRFTSNVAHELRTPIAELRTLAEVAIKWPSTAVGTAVGPAVGVSAADADGGAPPPAGSFHDVLSISREMEAMVAALLAIARCQAGQQPLVLTELELSAVVVETWRPHAAAARERGLRVDLRVDPAVVSSDRAALSAMLGNLFANAVAYTPADGHVAIRGERIGDGSRYALTVANTNDSLTPADLPLLLEPFWRKDLARTDSTNSGLGLTLVSTYSKLMNVDFTVELPSRELFVVRLVMACARP